MSERWEAKPPEPENNVPVWMIFDANGNYLCDVFEADKAHLIAAAPQLVEALEQIKRVTNDWRATEIADAALSAAKGGES